jgi:hypothetical protein
MNDQVTIDLSQLPRIVSGLGGTAGSAAGAARRVAALQQWAAGAGPQAAGAAGSLRLAGQGLDGAASRLDALRRDAQTRASQLQLEQGGHVAVLLPGAPPAGRPRPRPRPADVPWWQTAWNTVAGDTQHAWNDAAGGVQHAWKWIEDNKDVIHTVLDVVGMIPIVGDVANGANALLYLAEGDYGDAALSAAALIPLAADGLLATKLGVKALKYAKDLGVAERLFGDAAKAGKVFNTLHKTVDAVSYGMAAFSIGQATTDSVIDLQKGDYKDAGMTFAKALPSAALLVRHGWLGGGFARLAGSDAKALQNDITTIRTQPLTGDVSQQVTQPLGGRSPARGPSSSWRTWRRGRAPGGRSSPATAPRCAG